jgi:hypothetical protein
MSGLEELDMHWASNELDNISIFLSYRAALSNTPANCHNAGLFGGCGLSRPAARFPFWAIIKACQAASFEVLIQCRLTPIGGRFHVPAHVLP